MSEEVKSETPQATVESPATVSAYECGMCGLDGGPIRSCPLCAGSQRFLQARSFTLTEERQGKNPEADKKRYGPTGDVNPRIVVLPGGYDPSQGKAQ